MEKKYLIIDLQKAKDNQFYSVVQNMKQTGTVLSEKETTDIFQQVFFAGQDYGIDNCEELESRKDKPNFTTYANANL